MTTKDLNFIQFYDSIAINSVDYYSFTTTYGGGSSTHLYKGDPAIIEELGGWNRFTKVVIKINVQPTSLYLSQVLYAQKVVPFSIYDSSSILVTLKDDVIDRDNFSLTNPASFVISSNALTANKNVEMVFSLNPLKFRATSGILKLSQLVIKVLLTNTQSNRFLTQEGSSLLSILGTTMGNQQLAEVLHDSIVATEEFIMERQALATSKGVTISSEERLSSLGIESVNVVEDTASATIRMTTLAGKAFSIPIIL